MDTKNRPASTPQQRRLYTSALRRGRGGSGSGSG